MTERSCTWRIATFRSPQSLAQLFPRSKLSRSVWDGRFHWVSSFGSDFNYDYQVSYGEDDKAKGQVYYNYEMTDFPSEEVPGASVFYKNDAGEIFHTYSTYARGLDILVGTYNWLDIAPKGRDEDGLSFTMAWVRHHDKYVDNQMVDVNALYVQPAKTEAGRSKAEHK